jgi:hypothetical protein
MLRGGYTHFDGQDIRHDARFFTGRSARSCDFNRPFRMGVIEGHPANHKQSPHPDVRMQVQCTPEPIEKTWTELSPMIVRLDAPGPLIVRVVPIVGGRPSVMAPVTLKLMVPPVVAVAIASRSDPGPLPDKLVTVVDAGACGGGAAEPDGSATSMKITIRVPPMPFWRVSWIDSWTVCDCWERWGKMREQRFDSHWCERSEPWRSLSFTKDRKANTLKRGFEQQQVRCDLSSTCVPVQGVRL